MSDNIKVVVKVRPLISRELENKLPYQWRVDNNTLYQLEHNGRDFQAFTFDRVYDEKTKTSDLYNDVAKPIVEAATAGFNGTIFAYGQTSSGKTYTMTGTENSPGIIPLAVLNLFEIIKNIPNRDFLVRVSYIEIYNETVKDLLDVKKENIKIHENYEGNIIVDATEKVTSSPEEVLEAMRQGEANRQTGATNMNEKSSRSHSIFQITIESREHIEATEEAGCVNVSQLNLVDLAGSERAGQTGATGIRFKEGTHINKSLSALALVIKQLSEDPNKYANYRDSKLTRILQNSLGGNAKTSIVCAITPAALEETISTLQFATRAKAIKNKPEVNAVATDATMIQSLTKQLSKLQSQLEKKKNLEVMLENKKSVEQDLQKQIAALQKLILNGFGQRSSIDQIGGARRKQPPRRITISSISTLHSIDEDPVPTVLRFCTPSLKYNPMTVQHPSEFLPIQSSSSKLASLPEELPRLITPPPHDRKVNFMDEVIEIDSDDDDTNSTNSTIATCSPVHKCFDKSKTPPCILRKTCHVAEKNYQEILEFTEREKIFQPDVVELLEKLEQSANATAKLQDEVELLKKNSKEKDLEKEHLLFKIKKCEEDFSKAKMELEAHSRDLNDREVKYEIFKKKAEVRETELLSLLEEQKLKKCEDIGKLPPKPVEREPLNFMDMSKDMSLVNSDESSIAASNDEEADHMKVLVASLQDQLIEKSQYILQLEANISSQKKSIDFLEQSSNDLQLMINSFKEENSYLENENKLYKSNIDALNDSIKKQKENLITAQNDIATFTDTMQELQIKLTYKDNLLNMSENDSVLENMIANEEKVVTNNENIKNIIHSFKIALKSRDKEIQQLKSLNKESNDSKTDLMTDINDNKKQIKKLNEDIFYLQNEINSNVTTINILLQEKTNFAGIEEELTKKIAELENHKIEFSERNKENTVQIDNLTDTNCKLLQSLADKSESEQKYIQLNCELQKKLDEMSLTIIQNEKEIDAKNDMISSLIKLNNEKQDYENHAKSALDKLNNVLRILSGDIQNIPDFIDNCVTLFNALSSALCLLENVASDTVLEKRLVVEENSNLKTTIMELQKNCEILNTSQIEITQLQQVINTNLTEIEKLREDNAKLSKKVGNKDQKNCKNQLLLDNYEQVVQKLNEKLVQNQADLSAFMEKDTLFKLKIDDLETRLQHSDIALKTVRDELEVKEEILATMLVKIEGLKNELKFKHKQLDIAEEASKYLPLVKDQQIGEIFNRLQNFSNKLNVDENIISFEVSGDSDRYDVILLVLNKIASELDFVNNIKQEISEAKKHVETLWLDNQRLEDIITQLENENKILVTKLEINNSDKESFSSHIKICNEHLEQLKNDLIQKVSVINDMEDKARQYQKQFDNLNIVMNQKMQDLIYENETLKSCYQLSLENEKYEQTGSVVTVTQDLATSFEKPVRLSVSESDTNKELNVIATTPPSLLTICCNKIVDTMEKDSNLATPLAPSSSGSDTVIGNAVKEQGCAACETMSLELRILQQEKCSLLGILEQTERENKELILEQENIRREVRLLVEPAQKLQKKISSHKTNLCILTATTYAENRSLKSQVLALKHHHNKLLNVCQGDIPEVAKQLRELFVVLKGDSNTENQNSNLKRYSLPDVLDNNTTTCNFKNESTLDGDLLMLDTNLTLTTTGDNTLVGCDQTCFDVTQTMFNEVSCQSSNDPEKNEPDMNSHISLLETDSQNMCASLEVLKEENCKLKALVNKHSVKSSEPKLDMQSSPIKVTTFIKEPFCTMCLNQSNINTNTEEEVQHLKDQLSRVQADKHSIEKSYNNLVLQTQNTDAIVNKLNTLEKELHLKSNEITKLTATLNMKSKELKRLLDENDLLSTQIMENVTEVDDLNKELNNMRNENHKLYEKISQLETSKQDDAYKCPQCRSTVIGVTRSVPNADSPHTKLNRSLSDSETSSRLNKICTLQSELCAGREDCKDLTEHVATIKQHLNCSNMSIDLDQSIGDTNVSLANNVTQYPQQIEYSMPNIQEELSLDIYTIDKIDCYNYYLEITGEEKENVTNDIKIIDILKMFYISLLEKHGMEIENIKLKVYEESKDMFQTKLDGLMTKYSAVLNTLDEKESSLTGVSKLMAQVKCNVKRINNEINILKEGENLDKIVQMFKQNFLKNLDYQFGMSSMNVFEAMIDKFQDKFKNIKEQYASEQHKCNVEKEIVNKTLQELKSELDEKEAVVNLLKASKEKMIEINRAVTLDLVRIQQNINISLNEGCQKLLQHKLITSELALSESTIDNIYIIFNHIINQYQQQLQAENETLSLEVNNSKGVLECKEKELAELKSQIQTLRDVNNNVTQDLADREEMFQSLKTEHGDLNKAYNTKIEDNINKLNIIDKLTEEIASLKDKIHNNESLTSAFLEKENEIKVLLHSFEELQQNYEKSNVEISELKENINKKELLIASLSEKNSKITELVQSVKELQQDNERLMTINQMISKERESYSIDLKKSNETIKQNNAEIEKMTSDIRVLRESVKDATSIIESLKQELQKFTVVNKELNQCLEENKQECVRLEMNIKTHDKTAELQSKMIMRLKKQSEENERVIKENQTKINGVNDKYNILQNEYDKLKIVKESLEARVNELQEVADRRVSLDAIADSSRRRRRSIHDSKRMLNDLEEQRNLEDVFGSRQKPDDLFAEDDSSGRSTPFGLGKGRDSLLSRTDQSEKDEDQSTSRPSSVQAARRRRQSIHDMHRGVPRLTPSPHDLSSRVHEEFNQSRDTSGNRSDLGEISVLRAQLTSCQQELEKLKESYKELDDECETCSEYLKEAEAQCIKLRKEKAALEKQVTELKSSNSSVLKPSVAHVAVNTDEDWANLHAVVVDRMSYDAEVEKNKKLTKIIEELRFQKQDLKSTLTKMQKALFSNDIRELEATKRELKCVKEELETLKVKYKELDEECETCAEYLRERENQCKQLKEAKVALEIKLKELQEDSHALAHYSVRKKRQTVHDFHRNSVMDQTDASTETNDELLSEQAERDGSSQKDQDDKLHEMKRLKMMVDKLSHQKAAMEQQLKATQPMYVATGSAIVQNQQFTDAMKENQRLKKINAKLVNMCKKRGKSDANRENEDPCDQG